MKHIDLTLQVHKTNRVYKMAQAQLKKEIVMGHVGTHIDIYETKTIPLDYIETRGIVFDVRHIEDREITSQDINVERVKEKDFVLIRTGVIETYPYGSGLYFKKNAVLSWELIEVLIQKKIYLLGIDGPDLRKEKEHVEADKLCEKYGVYVVENLVHLEDLEVHKQYKMHMMWLEDPEATGIKCRVVATELS